MAVSKIQAYFILAALSVLIIACKGPGRTSGYVLQEDIKEPEDSTRKQIYITSTLPIDSVDVKKLNYDIFRIEYANYYPDSILLYARVFDSSGHFVTNMAKPYTRNPGINYWTRLDETLGKVITRNENIPKFTVREFGDKDSIPYNIVLSVDYSGSMTDVMQPLFDGTEIFISLKQEYDKIAISSFNKDYYLKVPLMKDKNKILTLYKNTRMQGIGLFSAVYDAVWNSLAIFDTTSPTVPRILVIFTDGDDNYSKKQMGELMDSAKSKNVHIFTIAFGYSLDDNLKYMAEYTGGKFYRASSKNELIDAFRDIYMSLRYYYLISYKPPVFWGWHHVISALEVPGRSDTLFATADYNTSDLFPWDSILHTFERPIPFDFDSSVIKPESYPIVAEIADAMLSQPRLKLEIQGHTDNVGGIEYNQALSDRRAKAVFDAIVQRGVEERRLRWRGFGMSQPLAPNDTEEGRAKNRRTQFVVIAK